MATETATANTQDDKSQSPKAPTPSTKSAGQALQIKLETPANLARPSLPNGRPIEPSYLRISNKYSLPGNRPVFVSDLTVADSSVFPGRPIFASNLKGHITDTIMGNRPVASNDLGDSDLMGYI